MIRIVNMRSRVNVEIGFVGWMHRTKPKIILRMKENGVYMWPNGFWVAYSSPANPAISCKFFTVIRVYDI